jgi:hypothetical protein
MPSRDPIVRRQVARIGGLTRAARYDGRVVTSAARRGFMARFEDEVDPDRQLPLDERQRRAQAAMRAHMARLALRSAKSRRKGAA